ncbi:hypothetical protein [Pseudomonas poae]|uniref:hypothetical protein n=1 Tax=Pseudomonas poae TaxID=200451 RepID=UPI003BB1E55D
MAKNVEKVKQEIGQSAQVSIRISQGDAGASVLAQCPRKADAQDPLHSAYA